MTRFVIDVSYAEKYIIDSDDRRDATNLAIDLFLSEVEDMLDIEIISEDED